jgi:hypothetical protein
MPHYTPKIKVYKNEFCACGCGVRVDRSIRPNSMYATTACYRAVNLVNQRARLKAIEAGGGDPFFAGF